MDFAGRSKGEDETRRLSKSRFEEQRRRERGLQEESDFFTNVTSRKRQRPRPSSCDSSPRRPASPVIVIGSEQADTPGIDGKDHGRSTNRTVPVSVPRLDQKQGAKMKHIETQYSRRSPSAVSWSSSHHSLYIRLGPPDSGVNTGHLPRMASEDSHLDGLQHAGVLDHTEIPTRRIAELHSSQDEQRHSVSKGVQCVKGLPNYSNSSTQTANYQDKGVMVSPWSDSHRGLPPSDSARQMHDPPGSGHSAQGSVARTIQSLNQVGTGHPKRPASRVGGTTDPIPGQCRPTQPSGVRAEAPYQPNDGRDHYSALDDLRVEALQNQGISFAQEGGSGAEKCARIGDESAFQQASGQQSQAPPVCSSPPGIGGHSHFIFPGNRSRVQPLRCGVPLPQEHGRPWTSVRTMPSDGTPLPASLQGQPFFSISDDGHVYRLAMPLSAEPVGNQATKGETLQEFIARIEAEVLGQGETDTHPGQDGEQLGTGDDSLDKRAVESRFDVDAAKYLHLGVSRTLDVGGGFTPVNGHRGAARSGTPLIHQTASQPWHNAHSVEDGDMMGFWRPNRLV